MLTQRLHMRQWSDADREPFAALNADPEVTFGFAELGLTEIVSFTTSDNRASRAVMERLGMTHDPADDFDHPLLPVGHRLCRHLLYRLGRPSRRPFR